MDKIIIKGGKPLSGMVNISGAKNAALPIIAACLLAGGWHRLKRIPQLRDIRTIKSIMSELGTDFREEDGELEVNSDNLTSYKAPYELVKTMRASILLLGPLLARCGKAKISLPGGCAIGARPVNLHLKALVAMGADIYLDHGYINAEANRLAGAEIFFDIPTVTGTENIMMAAVTARGRTVLRNAANEPEVGDLARMLRAMGADIEGDGTDTIVINGVDGLKACQHEIIPDRIEAGTFMIGAAITGGNIKIDGCQPGHLTSLIEKLRLAGAQIDTGDESIRIQGPAHIESVDIKTMPYPGFPTDLQAQFMSLMAVADGWSMIRETIFENRFIHVSELRLMGADIEINGSQALIKGKDRLFSAPVMATDLRASASLVLAGLVAEEGRTEVHRIYHLDRGYEAIEEKFRGLGATIWRERE
ncbi:MAG: UDP-N-acetylglucosamine 1-carboxyvinyltransferase [Proteobacteria bacterium]|nr:UDP-N-acetylglucosamine 1-carboxyvinyltransferase [Pseudomonadota bacterium]